MNEILKHPQSVTHSFANINHREISADCLDKAIDCTKYSTLGRLLRVTAYVLRFVRTLKCKRRGEISSNSQTESLTATEISQAESAWIRTVQRLSFGDEIYFIENGPDCSPPAYVVQFGLFLDDHHILRCKGRINNAIIPESTKKPVLLPSKHHFSDLVVQDVLKKVMHLGIRQTLITLRERFWVLRGREAVKRNLKKCITCRKHEGIAYNPPNTPDLPKERVSTEPPFTYTGLDFAGPLYVRDEVRKVSPQVQEVSKVFNLYVCLHVPQPGQCTWNLLKD